LYTFKADIDWWNAFKEGNREAFDSLFRHYYPILLQYGSKICPENDIINDCIQDLFIELWQSKTTTQVQSVNAYLIKALKYKLFRHFKKTSSVPRIDNTGESIAFEISHDNFIIKKEDNLHITKKIISAINQLPGRQKEIVYLKIYQNLSYEEISEVMNINYQVSRNLFYQSVKSLRQILAEK
jgi:RNA polymerase sigma factor (sigma-70 family)